MQYKDWERELAEEVEFWRMRLKNVDEAIQKRLNADKAPVPEFIRRSIPPETNDPIRILDVGAGPLTYLGQYWAGRRIELIPVDVLAEEYNKILDEYGLTPPVRTRNGSFEELPKLFGSEPFDFVNAGNCLDHCFDPIQAIKNCIMVLKPNRSMYGLHEIRVAEKQKYHGLHQWNLEPSENDVIISRPQKRYILSAELKGSVRAIRSKRVDNNRFDFYVDK